MSYENIKTEIRKNYITILYFTKLHNTKLSKFMLMYKY